MLKRIIYFACIFVIFINVSCASKTSASNSEQIEKSSEILTEESKEKEEIILMFDDWKYKGFNNEYPLWAEFAIKNDISNLQKVLNITSEQKINIIIHSISSSCRINLYINIFWRWIIHPTTLI